PRSAPGTCPMASIPVPAGTATPTAPAGHVVAPAATVPPAASRATAAPPARAANSARAVPRPRIPTAIPATRRASPPTTPTRAASIRTATSRAARARVRAPPAGLAAVPAAARAVAASPAGASPAGAAAAAATDHVAWWRRPAEAGHMPSIAVLTLNAHMGFNLVNRRFVLPELREAIRAVSADVVFLQEVMGEHALHAARVPGWPGA